MNMHQKGKRLIRVCELCGKVEGQHLKPRDFCTVGPSLVVKDYEGNDVKFSISLHVEDYNTDKTQAKLSNIVDSYMEQQEPPHPEPNQLNFAIQQMFEAETTAEEDETILCKVCFNGMIKMLTKYGKFDKVVVF